jgi:hypothetical protein
MRGRFGNLKFGTHRSSVIPDMHGRLALGDETQRAMFRTEKNRTKE